MFGKCRGSVAAIVAVLLATASPVTAQDGFQATYQRNHDFQLKPQPLRSAIDRFSKITGLDVLGGVAVPKQLRSPALTGSMAPQEALTQLLAGTEIRFKFTNATTVMLETAAQDARAQSAPLPQIDVTGQAVINPQHMIGPPPPAYAGGQVATGGQLGMLGNRSVMDTPFNQTSYTAQKVQDQQAQTVRDALIDDPSVQALWPSGSSSQSSVRIRGFDTGADVSFGGLYGVAPSWVIAGELAERIEVLKGPSALLNGVPPTGGIGGTINLVPKRAPDQGITQFTTRYSSRAQASGHADVGRRFGPNKEFGIRFNGVYRDGEGAVNRNIDSIGLASLGLDYRVDRFRLSADLGYQKQDVAGLISMPRISAGVPIPAVPDLDKNYGQPWAFASRKDLFGVVQAEVDVTDRITAFVSAGANDNEVRVLEGANLNIINQNGNATYRPSDQVGYYKFNTAQAGFRALVDTGPIRHRFVFSATTFEREIGLGATICAVFNTNIYNPIFTARPNIATPMATKSSFSTLSSYAFADTMSVFDERIQLTVGAREQRVTAENFRTNGTTSSSYGESALSPAVGLVVKPWKNVSLYGNYIQGLQQGTIVGSTFANAGQVFPPYVSTQYEAGVKTDWGRFTTTLSAFEISQPSTIVDTATNTLTLNGEQRNRGIEFNVFGELSESVRLLGGAMFMDARMVKTQGGVSDGLEAAGVPKIRAVLGSEWDTPFLRGLTLNGRVVHTTSQFVDITNPRRSIPDWTTVDLGARYRIEKSQNWTGGPVVVRFNVENVLGQDYWATTANSNILVQGTPRTFRLSSTFNF